MDVVLDALGYQTRQPHQEDVSTSSTDAHKELLAVTGAVLERLHRHPAGRQPAAPFQFAAAWLIARSPSGALKQKAGSVVVRRGRRVFVLNKRNPRWNARQG